MSPEIVEIGFSDQSIQWRYLQVYQPIKREFHLLVCLIKAAQKEQLSEEPSYQQQSSAITCLT